MYSSQRDLRGCPRIPSPTYPKSSLLIRHFLHRASVSCRALSSHCCSPESTSSSASSPQHIQPCGSPLKLMGVVYQDRWRRSSQRRTPRRPRLPQPAGPRAESKRRRTRLPLTHSAGIMADDLLKPLILLQHDELERSSRNLGSDGRIALCISLRAQRLYNIDARGAGGRQPRRDNRGGQEHERREEHGQGAWHLHVREIAARQTRHHEPECRAREDARRSHHGAFFDDTFQEMLRLRSERQTDAELARPRADRKRQHACDANQRNRQRDSREHAEHQRVQTVRREHLSANVFESGGVLDGLIGGHVANNARDRWDERIRICARVDEKAAAKDCALFKGAIDSEDGFRNNVFVVNIGGNANDTVRRDKTRPLEVGRREELQHRIGPIDVPVDGILIGEHAPCESLTDDYDGLFILVVEIVEITAGDDGNAERGKESGRDDTPLRTRIFFTGGMNMTVGGELEADTDAGIAPGSDHAESSLAHAG